MDEKKFPVLKKVEKLPDMDKRKETVIRNTINNIFSVDKNDLKTLLKEVYEDPSSKNCFLANSESRILLINKIHRFNGKNTDILSKEDYKKMDFDLHTDFAKICEKLRQYYLNNIDLDNIGDQLQVSDDRIKYNKEIIKSAEKNQKEEMDRSGIEDEDELPGGINS